MPYYHASSHLRLGERELLPTERVVVGTRPGSKEPRRIARYLGLSDRQPELLIDHREWADGEYLPTFRTSDALTRPDFHRYANNYKEPNGSLVWGQGLQGKTVYIVHTFSTRFDPQALDTMAQDIAFTAKYNGAENVVLLAYTFPHSAQERGVHQDHARMRGEEALRKFDGQAPLAQTHLMKYAVMGVDAIIALHNHCPDDLHKLTAEVNEELLPLHERALRENSTLRYRLCFFDVDLASMVGMFVHDYGDKNLEFNLGEEGKNILFLAPDAGIADFVRRARSCSGLTRAAFAAMGKRRADNGLDLQVLELVETDGLDPERGVEGMYVFIADDVIRSGATMAGNVHAFRGQEFPGLIRDPRIKGTPVKVAIYATRTNLAGNAPKVLSSPAINDIILTNADPRALKDLGVLDEKTQIIWVNFIMAEAAKAVERGEDPNIILTADYIREQKLIRVEFPYGHYSQLGSDTRAPL